MNTIPNTLTIDEAIDHYQELVCAMTYQSYEASRDAGMPYRPTDKSIWGKNNEQLEATYQHTLKRRASETQ